MKFVLISVENNYADEFDIEGFGLFCDEEAENAIKLINMMEEVPDQEIYFGSNESVFLHHTSFEIKELTEAEYRAIQSTLGDTYGVFNVHAVLDAIDEGKLFLKEKSLFSEYVNRAAEAAKSLNQDFYTFIRQLHANKEFNIDGVRFYIDTFADTACFTTEKVIDGEVYRMTFDTHNFINYFYF